MILKVIKEFMVFKQRDFIAKWFTVVDLHTLEAMFLLTTTVEKRPLCHCFVNSGFPRKTNFAWKEKLIYGEKRKENIFENCTCKQVNMAGNTALQLNNAHLDSSRCWQHVQEATKKLSHSRWVDRSK